MVMLDMTTVMLKKTVNQQTWKTSTLRSTNNVRSICMFYKIVGTIKMHASMAFCSQGSTSTSCVRP